MLKMLWMLTLVLAALGLVMGGAHLLEMPVRMSYEPGFYLEVTSTLYRYFGMVGGPLQVLALVLAALVTWRVRGRPAHVATLAGTVCLALSLLLWSLLVQPVNAAWREALGSGGVDAVQAYERLRERWEYGHLAAFAAWLMGFTLLLYGVLREVPRRRRA